MQKIKEGDVFKFRWSPKKEQGFDGRWHCFQGTLIAKKDYDGNLELVDTYWSFGNDQMSHRIKKDVIDEEVKKGGSFTFDFNLNDVESINEEETHYLDENDVVSISDQNACVPICIRHYKYKGKGRSKDKMLREINEKIRNQKSTIEYAANELERLSERRTKIESGDLTQYL